MAQPAHRWMMTEPGKPLEKADFDPFPPGPGEVVVEVAGCGVCHTDLGYFYDGLRTTHKLPLALGHEVAGRVVATGSGADAWSGKAVIVPAVIPCGECDLCKRGRGTICADQKMPGYDIQGGFGTHIVVPSHGLCDVDEKRLAASGLQLADLSVIADAVTTPYQAVVQAEIGAGALAVVVGVGGVGGYAAQIAAAFGATVVAVDVDARKLAAIADHGVALTLDAREFEGRELRQRIRAFADERGLPDFEWFIFECSGTTSGQGAAWGLLNRGATLCVVGFTRDRVELRLSNLMAFHARALGNWGCPPELYAGALDLVLDGRIQVAPFVERHPMDDINDIFDSVHAGKLARRAVLIPNGQGDIP